MIKKIKKILFFIPLIVWAACSPVEPPALLGDTPLNTDTGTEQAAGDTASDSLAVIDTSVGMDTDTSVGMDTDTSVGMDTDTGNAMDTDTNNGIDTGNGPQDTETVDTEYLTSCDGKGDCWGDTGCAMCALDGPCQGYDRDCRGDAACRTLYDCISPGCDTEEDTAYDACADNCKKDTPSETIIMYEKIDNCILHDACKADCIDQ
jgi:hypothetical protein